jgi:DNA-directed RNA polymerase specialized sigma24 family protein
VSLLTKEGVNTEGTDMKALPMDLSRSGWLSLISERIIGRNAFRDREILVENLLDGRTYEWIAEYHDLSVRQVARILQTRRNQLYK